MPQAAPFLLFASVAATVISISQQRSAARDARRAEKAAQRRSDNAAQRARIKNVRRGRIQRANVEAAGTSGEGTGGSGLTGTTQGLFQQQATNLAFLDQQQRISNEISSLNISAAGKRSKASTAAGIASITGDFGALFLPEDTF